MNELDIYDRQGFGNQRGFGKQPALLVVDFVNGLSNPDEFGGGNIGGPSRLQKFCCRIPGLPEYPLPLQGWSTQRTVPTPASFA